MRVCVCNSLSLLEPPPPTYKRRLCLRMIMNHPETHSTVLYVPFKHSLNLETYNLLHYFTKTVTNVVFKKDFLVLILPYNLEKVCNKVCNNPRQPLCGCVSRLIDQGRDGHLASYGPHACSLPGAH